MDASPSPSGRASDAPLTELETIAVRFAHLDPGKTKRGKPRKRRNLKALAAAMGLPEDSLHDAYLRATKKKAAKAA